jgi:flagellar biosynthesis GTPase FlhF
MPPVKTAPAQPVVAKSSYTPYVKPAVVKKDVVTTSYTPYVPPSTQEVKKDIVTSSYTPYVPPSMPKTLSQKNLFEQKEKAGTASSKENLNGPVVSGYVPYVPPAVKPLAKASLFEQKSSDAGSRVLGSRDKLNVPVVSGYTPYVPPASTQVVSGYTPYVAPSTTSIPNRQSSGVASIASNIGKMNVQDIPTPAPVVHQTFKGKSNLIVVPTPAVAVAAKPAKLSAIAMYDYTATEDNEISLSENETITDINQVDPDWWSGTNSRGLVGLFPATYVELLPSGAGDTDAIEREQSRLEKEANDALEKAREEARVREMQEERDRAAGMDREREMKERQERETRERQDRERLEREEREARERAERESKERQERERREAEERAAQEQEAKQSAAKLSSSSITAVAMYDYSPTEDNEIALFENGRIVSILQLDADWYLVFTQVARYKRTRADRTVPGKLCNSGNCAREAGCSCSG